VNKEEGEEDEEKEKEKRSLRKLLAISRPISNWAKNTCELWGIYFYV
jgi:hypothetical protein